MKKIKYLTLFVIIPIVLIILVACNNSTINVELQKLSSRKLITDYKVQDYKEGMPIDKTLKILTSSFEKIVNKPLDIKKIDNKVINIDDENILKAHLANIICLDDTIDTLNISHLSKKDFSILLLNYINSIYKELYDLPFRTISDEEIIINDIILNYIYDEKKDINSLSNLQINLNNYKDFYKENLKVIEELRGLDNSVTTKILAYDYYLALKDEIDKLDNNEKIKSEKGLKLLVILHDYLLDIKPQKHELIEVSNEKDFEWFYSTNKKENSAPACASMAVKWVWGEFDKTVEDVRNDFVLNGDYWNYQTLMYSMRKYNLLFERKELNKNEMLKDIEDGYLLIITYVDENEQNTVCVFGYYEYEGNIYLRYHNPILNNKDIYGEYIGENNIIKFDEIFEMADEYSWMYIRVWPMSS